MTEEQAPQPAAETPAPAADEAPSTDLVELFRGQRDRFQRKSLALEAILQAHSIKYQDHVRDVDLEKLPLYRGQLEGYSYSAPAITIPAPKPARSEKAAEPTLDEVRKWSTDKINQNWDTVKQLMKRGNSK